MGKAGTETEPAPDNSSGSQIVNDLYFQKLDYHASIPERKFLCQG
jgi:hypothetical protein